MVEGDTAKDGVKRFTAWQAGRYGDPGFDPGSSEKGTKVRDREGVITSTQGRVRSPDDYARAPPRAPGSGGATSGATTCLGGFSGAGFLLGDPPTPGGGLISRPCSRISLIWEPSRVSYSSSAFAIVSSVSRFVISVRLAN